MHAVYLSSAKFKIVYGTLGELSHQKYLDLYKRCILDLSIHIYMLCMYSARNLEMAIRFSL